MNGLNLGCGADVREGWVNVDIDARHDPDLVHDLEATPWPLPSGTFDRVLMDNVIEHLDPPRRPDILAECHRVLRPMGDLIMRWPLPGVGGGWDVTHYQIPSWEWTDHPRWGADWTLVDREFRWSTLGRWLPDRVARELAWHGIRTAIGVEVRVQPEVSES
jgi:predicted SAM-dependent methyltransferase